VVGSALSPPSNTGKPPGAPIVIHLAGPTRSAFVRSVLDPTELKLSFSHVGQNLLLAALLVLLIAFPSELFNATVQEHYDEINGWVHRGRLAGLRRRLSQLPTPLVLAFFGAGGALLYSQLSPGFGFNKASLALLIGMFLAIAGASFIFDVTRASYIRRRFSVEGRLKAFPTGLALGALLVLLSRVVHFQPGYLYGLFTGLVFQTELSQKREGESMFAAGATLLGIGAAAWLLWIPVKHLATHHGASLGVLSLDAALSSLWIAAMCGIVFGLLPIRWLNGEKVFAWSRAGWALIYGVAMFVFIQTALLPKGGFIGSSKKGSLLSMLILFVSFGALSVLFWGYFRYRHVWQGQPAPVDEGL
jgi:hypothetical protein